MKKLLALLLAAVMVMSLAACGSEEAAAPAEPTEAAEATEAPEAEATEAPADDVIGGQTVNPITELASLAELNEACKVAFVQPGVMGVTDEKFMTIDCGEYVIGEYDFTVNGLEYFFRCASTTDDISGVYLADGSLFGNVDGEVDVVSAEGWKGSRWFTIDGQYTLAVNDNDTMDEETFAGIAAELKEGTLVLYGTQGDAEMSPEFAELSAVFNPLAGEYQDETSQRAMLTFESFGSCAEVTVSWADSASVTEKWEMTLYYNDGKFTYEDCDHTRLTYADEASEPELELISMAGTGYFELSEDGKLLWTGAEDEDCKACSFVKVDAE